MIALLSEALCFITYLSLYLHRIFKSLFFFFSVWGGGGHAFGYLSMKASKFNKNFADVSIS